MGISNFLQIKDGFLSCQKSTFLIKSETYVIGNKHKDVSPKGQSWHVKRPFEPIHSNFYSIKVPYNVGSRCLITFNDDFSRKARVYFLKHELEACNALKNFLTYVEAK